MIRDNLPNFIYDIKQMKELIDAEESELEYLYKFFEEFSREFNIFSCIDTIKRFEKDYEIEPNEELPIAQRRLRILIKKYQKLLPTIVNLEDAIKRLVSADVVKIKEVGCRFDIYIGSALLLENMDIAKKFFKDVRPAHFEYKFINSVPRDETVEMYIGVNEFVHKKMKFEVVV
nr:MAG TPA: tail protein [Caudoviricetes sp.]